MQAEAEANGPHGTNHLVLLSGGIDSSTALVLALGAAHSVSSLFVDYGQAAATTEARASAAIAANYRVDYARLTCTGWSFGAGEIQGRNAFLVHAALMFLRRAPAVVVLGIHSGTAYRDCTQPFVELMQRSFDFHSGGQLSISAPFLGQPKVAIVNIARQLGVPLTLTYSCEAGNEPCGECMSCRDREAFLAGS